VNERRFTDEQRTTIALHGLINDMHHVLGRIVTACYLGACIPLVVPLFDAFAGRWIVGIMHAAGAAMFVSAAFGTERRQRKYRPAVGTIERNDA